MSNESESHDFNKNESWVKGHFIDQVEKGVKRKFCLAVGCDRSYNAKISTNHLKEHWKKAHLGIEPMTGKNIRLHNQDWNHHLILYIVKARKEFSMVENEYFLNFTNAMNSNKPLISRRELSEKIKSSCRELRSPVKKLLQNQISIALTFDIWTAYKSFRSFAAITAHFVDEKMNLKCFLLEFKRLKYPHDTSTVKEFLASAIKDFGIEKKVVSITGDNASVNTSSLRELTREMGLGASFGFGSVQVRCIAHIINLAVKQGLEELKPKLEPIRKFVNVINSSTKRRERFIEIQEVLIANGSTDNEYPSIKKPYQLVDEVETRWNSTYMMIERFILIRHAVEEAIKQMPELRGLEFDWVLILSLKDYLEPYFELTKHISGTNYSAISLVRSSLPLIIRHTIKFEGDDEIGLSAEALSKKLEEYKSIMDADIAEIATILDPRFKLSCFEQGSHDELKTKLRDYVSKFEKEKDNMQSSQKSSSMFAELFIQQDLDDVERYCNEPRFADTTDVLSWWHANMSTYPRLARLARIVLCVQPTSVAAESTFSLAGLVDNQRRANLSDESFEASLLLNSWYDLVKTDSA